MDVSQIFIIITLAVICFFPVLLWWYGFSFIDSSGENKKKFLIGILSWSISVYPILYLDRIFEIPELSFMNIFSNIFHLESSGNYMLLWLSFLFLISFLAISLLVFWTLFRQIRGAVQSYFMSFVGLLIVIVWILVFFWLIEMLSQVVVWIENTWNFDPPIFGNAVFNSLKLIIFYYVVIALIEESAKHFSFLSSNIVSIDSVKKGVLYSMFIALWFAFLENILYGIKIYEEQGFTWLLIIILFYRSLFSLFIHVFSSAILGYFFTKAYLLYKNKNYWVRWFLLFIYGIVWAIVIHFSFDVLVTLGYTKTIFIYFILGYFWITKIVFLKN
jgi:RsiW-degrading membrane proteinase PrsW (M82 family)